MEWKETDRPSPFYWLGTSMFDLIIQTENLVVRTFRLSDAPRVRELAGKYEIAHMVGSIPHPYPSGMAEQWIGRHDERRREGKGYPFAIVHQGQLIGSVGLETDGGQYLELGYWLGTEYWRRGYMSEAAKAVLQFAFGWLSKPGIQARVIVDNAGSKRILEKLGFLFAGHQETVFHNVRQRDVEIVHYVLTRDAWTAHRI